MRGISQEGLGRKVGRTQSFISVCEHAGTHLLVADFLRICHALDKSPYVILRRALTGAPATRSPQQADHEHSLLRIVTDQGLEGWGEASAMPPRQPRWPSRRPAITPAWRVSAARAVPIAAGENAAGLHDFHAQFEGGSIDVAQPSVIKIGVPSAMPEIAALAKAFGVRVLPHSAYFGPGFLASLHVNATIAPDAPFERLFIDLEASPLHDLVAAKDGGVTVPRRPSPRS